MTSQGSTNLAKKKNYLEYFSDMHQSRGESGKEMFWSQTLRSWRTMDASEINPRRIKCKRSIDATKGWTFLFPVADGTAKLSGRDHEFREPTLWREQPVSERSERRTSRRTRRVSTDRNNRWRWIPKRLLVDPRWLHLSSSHWTSVQLYVPKEETFLIPLKYIDVTTATETNLDVLQERDIDDYWNVDANRSLSDSWKGFTKFTLLKEKPPKGYLWSGRRLTKIQATARPENFVAWSLVQNGKSRSEERKARMGKWEGWEALISSIRKMVNIMEPSKAHG